jgi:hypothetical protein
MPEEQAVHVDDPIKSWKVPALQLAQIDAPEEE